MIAFVQDTGGSFTTFYNGPECGASAPDHLHFQACPAGSIPLVLQFDKLHTDTQVMHPVSSLCTTKTIACSVGELDRRALFFCSTTDPEVLQHQIHAVVVYLQNETASAEEPLINIIISGSNQRLQGIIFPRKAHRPACYFSRGKSKLLVSPGAVDIGGLIVLPRREDFERITGEQILNIFSEVCYGKDIFKNL